MSSRLGLTVVATIIIALALGAGAAVFVQVQRSALQTTLDAELAARADRIELSLAGGILTDEVADPRSDDHLIQIVDILDRVVASSPNLEGAPPLADWTTGVRTLESVPFSDSPYRLLTTETTRTTEPLTIHVGASYELIAEAGAILSRLMLVAVPVLVLLFGALTWLLLGRPQPGSEVVET